MTISIRDIFMNMEIYKNGSRLSELRNESVIYIAFHGDNAVYCGKSKPLKSRLGTGHEKIEGCGMILVFYHQYANACEELLLCRYRFPRNVKECLGTRKLLYADFVEYQNQRPMDDLATRLNYLTTGKNTNYDQCRSCGKKYGNFECENCKIKFRTNY